MNNKTAFLVNEVRNLILSGVTKTKACQQIGISRVTFNRYIDNNTNADIIQVKDIADIDYNIVTERHGGLVNEILRRSSNISEMGDKELFAYESKLSFLKDKMERELGINTKKEIDTTMDAATEYLKTLTGPNLRPGKTVIMHRETTIEFQEEEKEKQEAIEGSFKDDNS